jgi:hypothetical protein
MIEFSEKCGELAKAMLAVQGAVSNVLRDATNPHFKNRYATLENVVAAIRPPCVANNLVVMQAAGEPSGGMIPVETRIIHAESGEWMKSTIALPATKPDAQGFGSAITYACRYSLMSLFNLPPADDDGNAASVKNGTNKPADSHTTGGMTKMDARTVKDGRQKSSGQAKKDGDQSLFEKIGECESRVELGELYKEQRAAIEALPANWQNIWFEKYDERMAEVAVPLTMAG